MTDLNVDDFFKDAARTLVFLFTSFPTPTTVFVEDISGPDEPDEYGVHSKRYLATLGTLQWLAEEGYLRYTDLVQTEAIDQAVLTARCFGVLCASEQKPEQQTEVTEDDDVPNSVRAERSTNIHLLRRILKSRSSNHLRQAMLALMEQMLSRQAR
jgi:hypothetical protein